MSELSSDEYIPYLAIAMAIMETDNSPELYLLSLFPDATPEKIASFSLYCLAKFHDGIIQGVELSCHEDPMSVVEAFQIGVQEGLSKR